MELLRNSAPNSRKLCEKLLIVLSKSVVTILLILPITASAGLNEKIASAMHRVFGENTTLCYKEVVIDSATSASIQDRSHEAYSGTIGIHTAVNEKKEIVGFGIVDDVQGKSQPITYLALINPDGSANDVEVLIYREPYGGEISYETFRKQFRGKNSGDRLKVGRDIRNIAGATISSNAITNGVKKLLIAFDELRKRGTL